MSTRFHMLGAAEMLGVRQKPELPPGVDFYVRTGRYRARINIDGVQRTLGYFETAEAASAAYEAAKMSKPDRGLHNIKKVRSYLEQNLGCKKKEVIAATGLDPRTVAKAIRIIRSEPRNSRGESREQSPPG